LPGLWAIYDAAQGVTGTTSVTAWADQSGNGNNLTLANPLNPVELVAAEINSLPAVHSKFTGAYGDLISATNALPALTAGGVIWAVVKQTTADISIDSGITNFMQTNSEFEIKRHNLAVPGAICATALGSSLASVIAADNVYHIVRLIIGVSNLKLAINDGIEDVKSVFNTPIPSTFSMFGIGDKYIAYVAIATNLPSSNDIDEMEIYLNTKFNVY